MEQEETKRQQIKQEVEQIKAQNSQLAYEDEEDEEDEEEEDEIAEVCAWLEKIKMHRYKDLFIEEGFDCFAALEHITAEDLMTMGVKRGHSRLIFAEVEKLKSAGTS